MKVLIVLLACFLVGCTTTTTIEKPIAEQPPPELVATPMPIVEIVASSDGTVDLKGALSVAMQNNAAARHNAIQLQKLEEWLKKTEENVNNSNKR